LAARKITNPDAPIHDHFIRLRVDGEERLAIPILLSRSATYDASRAAPLFDYLQFRFLLVEKSEGSGAVKPLYNGAKPRTVGIEGVVGYFEQVGRNTRYIIHPEEILADNFALLAVREPGLATPSIVDSLKARLSTNPFADTPISK
jgi:hypothetical protein